MAVFMLARYLSTIFSTFTDTESFYITGVILKISLFTNLKNVFLSHPLSN